MECSYRATCQKYNINLFIIFCGEERSTITCRVTGTRQYFADLPKGGLEIPCKLCFEGSIKEFDTKTPFFFSPVTIAFTSFFAAAIEEEGRIIESGPLR